MTNPVDFLTYITLIGTSVGIYLGLFLLFIKSEKNKANIFLAMVIWLVTWVMLPEFLACLNLLETFPHVVFARVLVPLIGPVTYFYMRICTQKGFELRPILYLHFIPFLINLIFHIPFLMASGEEKIAAYLFRSGSRDPSFLILHVLRAVHASIYFVASARLVFLYKKHLLNTASYIDVAYHRWLLVFCTALLFPTMGLVFHAFLEDPTLVIKPLFLMITLFLIAALTGALLKPAVFHTFPHQMLIPNSSEEQKQKYENSNLQATQKEQFVEKLLDYMQKEKSYLQAELSLTDLAEQLDIPTHYLSQVINEKMNCNFLDFINRYRIEDAKVLLRDEKFEHYTIIAIAYEAGFNSKSAFYSAFKKFADTTPSKFRKLKPVEHN